MNIELLKTHVSMCQDKTASEIISYLSEIPELDIPMKTLVYNLSTYPIFQDGELPMKIKYSRYLRDKTIGFNDVDIPEISILASAYRSQQYKRFIKHLVFSFLNPTEIFPVISSTEESCGCSICGKVIYEEKRWLQLCEEYPSSGENLEKNFLQFSAKNTNISLCKNCIIQLKGLSEILKELEPGLFYQQPTK